MKAAAVVVMCVLAAAAAPSHAQGVTVTFTTTPHGGTYAPKNVVVAWVENAGGTFLKTMGRWGNQRKSNLVAWSAKSPANDIDAITGATRVDHNGALTARWTLIDQSGQVVPDGTYTIYLELADSDTNSTSANNEASFTVVKSPAAQVQNNLAAGGFESVSIVFAPTAGCDNGVVDPGETCDPSASCPASCPVSADACKPNVLTGDAAHCTAECNVVLVTSCTAGDNCCPPGCTTATDADCGMPGVSTGGGGADDNAVTGGCSTSQPGAMAAVLLAFVGLGRRRRRSKQ